MDWLLVGYLAKRRATRAGWVSPWPEHPDVGFPLREPVAEICSVSNCIARGLHAWDDPDPTSANSRLGLYLTPSAAWSRVPADEQQAYALYAYRLWPVEFDDGVETEIDVWWETPDEPLGDSFVQLGWDAVEGGNQSTFGCSPLSCNSGCDVVNCSELNPYCLVANESAALALARRFSLAKPEPGPYCAVDVWRRA